ncbi:hypothetical protein KKF82_07910 [Patescibacteria group bacterium]|uniref:Uncharacterized protein n=1 Tax=viral metagenome TaxID=1070528 RepID=A0A6M3M8D1_9ZZZZ|nr:hypothetical protein [Patescibacteria group bacterium]
MKLEAIGKIMAAGFGDKVLSGLIVGILRNVTPDRCCEYIDKDIELGHWASDNQWERFRRMAKGANVKDITSEDIINDLRKHKPDILGVIINHPRGREWLDTQLDAVKKKLEI